MDTDASETSTQPIGSLLQQLRNDEKKLIRDIENVHKKICNAQCAITFNNVCLRENILPGYTNIRLHDESARNDENTRRFRRELVERQIAEKIDLKKRLSSQLHALTTAWNLTSISEALRNEINHSLNALINQHRRGIEANNLRKLSNLYGGNLKIPKPIKGYINLANIELTPDQEDLLNKGLNCHFMSKPKPHRKRIEMEVLLDDIQKLEKDGKVSTTPELQHLLLTEATRSRGSYQSKIINKKHHTAAKQLRENNDIIIRRADKTAAFVIANKNDYIDKMNAILSDETKFKIITRNPTELIKKRVNNIISSINAIENDLKLHRLTGEYSLGYAYGNYKTHKPGNPLRPIISQIPTATYNIAKKLNELLTPYVPSSYSLSSVSDFIEILRDAPHADNQIIASLDVESLFTNVPIDTTIEYILNRVYRCNETTPLKIPEKLLKELLEVCTKEAPFLCPSGKMYKQVDGIAMGSPLGVLFANFYMGTIETELLKTNKPSIYCRYIDDIFVRVNDIDHLKQLQQKFMDASVLNFTYEEATNGRLPFLDVLITASTTETKTSVYTKPTNMGLCLNGESECPKRYTSSTISAYVRRAISHCSTWKDMHLELDRLTQVLINNGYSNNDVHKTIEQQMDKWYTETTTTTTTNASNHIKLYYQNQMSTEYKMDEKILRDIIHKNVKPSNKDTDIKLIIYYRTRKTAQLILRNKIMNVKTPLQEDHVIYQYTCNSGGCGPHSYIGMTRTKLTRRLTCHLQNGAIKNHLRDSHNAILNRENIVKNTEILDREQDPRRLSFLEAIYIQIKKPRMNIQADILEILPTSRRHASQAMSRDQPTLA